MEYTKEPERYLRALLIYALEGNAETDWRVDTNQKRKWFHAPWMHYDDKGREPIRGLTRERTSRPMELHPAQTSEARNWAVSVYNEAGAYTFGQVWKDVAKPDTRSVVFPAGTVSIKLLFTTASDTQVPYLKGSKEWYADINRDGRPEKVRLLQVDVAARDPDADGTTGWVFGTFMYHADEPGGTPYEKLRPVGLIWGNNPCKGEAEPPSQGWLNPVVAAMFSNLPRRTLGFQGRVNGPVDNPRSSCLSCHASAHDRGFVAALIPPMAPPQGATPEQIAPFFRNLKPTDPAYDGFRPLDYSLQIAVGVNSFRTWVADKHPAEITSLNPYPTPPTGAVNFTCPNPELIRMMKENLQSISR